MKLFERSFWNKVRLHIKDTAFPQPYEHLLRAIRYANKIGFSRQFQGNIIDVGAYDGKTAQIFSKHFPMATIKAFEPNPNTMKLLETTVSNNKMIEIYQTALSAEEGDIPFYVTYNSVSSSLNKIDTDSIDLHGHLAHQLRVIDTVKVNCRTLDSYNFKEVLFLKLDTQGNELKVLKGASETLRHTQFVISEMAVYKIYDGGCKYYETDEILRNAGFEPIDIIVSNRKNGVRMVEFEAIYRNTNLQV